jgi:RNase H-fold protein (predicted Holliday junction resolvase)
MSIDKVVLEKVKEKLKENNQSEEMIEKIVDLLKKRDVQDLVVGEKNEFIEKILLKTKI